MTKDTFQTTEAFKRLLDHPDLWRRTGRRMGERYDLKSKLRCGVTVTLKTKMKILEQAGYIMKQEALWQIPEPVSAKTSPINKG